MKALLIYQDAKNNNCKIIIPEDCLTSLSFEGEPQTKDKDAIKKDDIILENTTSEIIINTNIKKYTLTDLNREFYISVIIINDASNHDLPNIEKDFENIIHIKITKDRDVDLMHELETILKKISKHEIKVKIILKTTAPPIPQKIIFFLFES